MTEDSPRPGGVGSPKRRLDDAMGGEGSDHECSMLYWWHDLGFLCCLVIDPSLIHVYLCATPIQDDDDVVIGGTDVVNNPNGA
jgi:hypothetical protein